MVETKSGTKIIPVGRKMFILRTTYFRLLMQTVAPRQIGVSIPQQVS